MKILIIGVGNIGKRHLESLRKSSKIKEFYLVDKKKLENQNFERKFLNSKLYFYKNINHLEKKIKFDLVVISTNSDVRYKIFKFIVSNFKVKYFILEKFVFQNIKHYKYALNIIKNQKLKVFINCPMRNWPLFKKIRDKDYKKNIKIKISGSKWGLASNAIHYIDLLIFFTNRKKIYISNKNEMHIYKSKRENFIEFAGSIHAKVDNNNHLIMNDDHNKNLKPEMTIELKNILYEFDAGRHYYYVKKFNIKKKDEKKLISSYKFKTPLQSQLTLRSFSDILLKKNTIPEYKDLFEVNVSLTKLFLNSYNTKFISKNKYQDCPIT